MRITAPGRSLSRLFADSDLPSWISLSRRMCSSDFCQAAVSKSISYVFSMRQTGSTPPASTNFRQALQGEGQIVITGRNVPFIPENPSNRYYYADMSDLSFKSISELQVLLGEQLRALRLSKDLDQIATAEKAGISEKALRNLEAGRGSTVESFLRVLKALNSLDGLELLAPKPSVSPLALLRSSKTRQRVRQPLASRHRNP